jgi:hypothetical protein
MATQRIFVPEWRDDLKDSRYPFTDSSSLESSGGVSIDKDMFVDAVVYPIGYSAPIYLRTISAEARLVTFSISDASNTLAITGSVDPFGTDDSISLTDNYGRPAGLLVCGPEKIARLQAWPLGEYSFDDNAEFVASVVIPMPENHLSGFILPDGSVMTGDVWFVGENGVVVRYDVDDDAIRFDLVGDPLFKRALCSNPEAANPLFVTPNFLRTINGLKPDEHGNFFMTVNNKLAGDSILRIYPDASNNSVIIEFVGQRLESIL